MTSKEVKLGVAHESGDDFTVVLWWVSVIHNSMKNSINLMPSKGKNYWRITTSIVDKSDVSCMRFQLMRAMNNEDITELCKLTSTRYALLRKWLPKRIKLEAVSDETLDVSTSDGKTL